MKSFEATAKSAQLQVTVSEEGVPAVDPSGSANEAANGARDVFASPTIHPDAKEASAIF